MDSKRPSTDLETDLKNLSISPTATPSALKIAPFSIPSAKSRVKKYTAVAESWEDEVSDSEDQNNESGAGAPGPPPPTPTTPLHNKTHTRNNSSISSIASPRGESFPFRTTTEELPMTFREREEKSRPATTDAVARRMISAALGVRAPKSTKEQRDFDKAMREKEKKKRDDERERRKEEERKTEEAKRSAWEN